ncbi:acrylate utilization transcriptional regulator AcuR [Ideonella livida]|uniref:TetR family transcriptional regulator n=1 Tax=Ideonella livida TaxID=2707176 RepID=A0A7C9TLS9_9BURK|nr:TetR/AcrR family transcriptional regulator [Ideonella livida]NDY93760.1 TetR family transcriptional regulator [Ideonella livida]
MSSPDVTPARRRGRPPRQRPEGDEDTRALLLRTGLAVLTEKGYSAVALDEILRLAQLPKGSFYHCFASKEAFGQALIQAYAAYFAQRLDRSFLDTRLTPLARLRHFVDEAQRGMARYGFKRGCLVGNLGQEMGTLPESFRAQLVAVLHDWEARTAACLRAAQQAGELSPAHDCAALAHYFWTGWEGAVLRAKLERSPTPLAAFGQGFLQGLGAKPAPAPHAAST